MWFLSARHRATSVWTTSEAVVPDGRGGVCRSLLDIGIVADFDELAGPTFDPSRVDGLVQ